MNKKTELEVAKALSRFENRFQAYKLTVNGISVWRLLRSPVGYAMQDLPLVIPNLRLWSLMYVSLRSLWDMIRKPSGNIRYVVKSYTSALRYSLDGITEDVYFGQLLRQEPGGLRLNSLNTTVNPKFNQGADQALDCTAIRVVASFMALIFPVRDRMRIFRKLSFVIESELGVRSFSARRIRHMFSSFWWQAFLFEKLFRKLSPQVVIVSDSGERAVIAACKRSNVKVVELQHGVFTENDPDCLPFSAFDNHNEEALVLPDVLALYGEYWVERHKNTLMGKLGRTCAVGAEIIDQYRDQRISRHKIDLDCLKFVVTSQGLDRDQLIYFLSEFLKDYKDPCNLYIKLHPVYDHARAPFLDALGSDARVHVVDGLKGPNTLDLIAEADFHISIASACHFEAIGIGCPTVILGLAGHEVVSDLIEEGYTYYAENPRELIQIVTNQCLKSRNDASSNMFYSKNFVRRMSALIE